MRLIDILYSAAGVKQTSEDGVYTLAASTTYYAELVDQVDQASILSCQWTYGATLIAEITIEATNRRDLSTFDGSATAGWAATGAPAVSAAGAPGTVLPHYADFGAMRARAKIVVAGGGGGTLRGDEHSKGGG